MIEVRIKMFSRLQKYLPPNADINGWNASIEQGASVRELLVKNNIPVDVPMVITVNDTNVKSDYLLQDKDSVKLFPIAMGG